MKMLMVIVGLSMMTGCAGKINNAQNPHWIMGPDGKRWHIATCYDDHAGCLVAMGDYCAERGYEIASDNKDTVSDSRGFAFHGVGSWKSSTSSTEAIMFRCKENNQTMNLTITIEHSSSTALSSSPILSRPILDANPFNN
jgi:hypothetical protein